MKQILFTVAIVAFFIVGILAQQSRSPGTGTITAVRGLTTMTNGKDRTIFVGGYAVEVDDYGKIVDRYGLLWKLRTQNTTVHRLKALTSIDYIGWFDSASGMVSGSGYGAYITRDGGETWEALSKEVSGKAFFFNQELGWFQDKDGNLSLYVDGVIRTLHRFPDLPYIKKVEFTDASNGWMLLASNEANSFAHTQDGGSSWIRFSKPLSQTRDFNFISVSTGFVITSNRIYRTDDGGNSWIPTDGKGLRGWFNKVFFLDKNNGWIIGDHSCRTADGGSHWVCATLDAELANVAKMEFTFVDPNHGFLLTEKGLYETSNGGKDWIRKVLIYGQYEF